MYLGFLPRGVSMLRSAILVALMGCSVTFFVSCTPHRQGASGVTPPGGAGNNAPTSPLMPPPAQGTADSGGGNTYAGKPLESYIQDITKLNAYQSQIKPIFDKVRTD